jgi:excisionase family DNA binding protein
MSTFGVMSAEEHDKTSDWLSLQEASMQLGVTTSTLRRWGDSGRVPMKRTLGGHRRFPREAIDRLIQAPPSDMVAMQAFEPQPNWNFDVHELVNQKWHARFSTNPVTERMRGLGQRLLGLLIQYLNRRESDRRFLNEARTVGETYGREAQEADISLHDAVEAFLYFRSAFSHLKMPLPGIPQPTDFGAAMSMHVRIDQFMDAILLGMVAGYEGADAAKAP